MILALRGLRIHFRRCPADSPQGHRVGLRDRGRADEKRVCGRIFDGERFHFFDRMHLWFNRGDQQESPEHDEADNVITLSESFYEEVNQHPIPVERQVVAGLANAPGLLDFYVWIVWKSWAVKAVPARIPLFGPQGLEAQLGASTYSRNKRFRQTLRQWLMRIKLFWPECPAEPSHDGKFLIVRSSSESPAIHQATAQHNPDSKRIS